MQEAGARGPDKEADGKLFFDLSGGFGVGRGDVRARESEAEAEQESAHAFRSGGFGVGRAEGRQGRPDTAAEYAARIGVEVVLGIFFLIGFG